MADREIELIAAPPHHALASTSNSIAHSPGDSEIEIITVPPHHALASTSNSIAHSPGDYDVFINHRGPDVKNTFASHLYRRLVQRGLRVFLDKPELQEGLNFTSQIQGAIRSASVHVAIFSPRYAQSKWCLDELLQMFESGAAIIPVFYHVKPGQLRWTLGDGGVYSKDLRKLEEKKTYDTETHEEKPRHDPSTIIKWREALSRVAEISGFELDASYTDEGELLDKVVECVVKKERETRLNTEEAQSSENTILLEEQERKGQLEVRLQWSSAQFRVLWWPILRILLPLIGVVVLVYWVKVFVDYHLVNDVMKQQFDQFDKFVHGFHSRGVPQFSNMDQFGPFEDQFGPFEDQFGPTISFPSNVQIDTEIGSPISFPSNVQIDTEIGSPISFPSNVDMDDQLKKQIEDQFGSPITFYQDMDQLKKQIDKQSGGETTTTFVGEP